MRSSPGAAPRPLLPVSERKSQEENTPGLRAKKSSDDDDKWDIAPDGASAGREGRQFAVWNVGNNGRIYLRYVAANCRFHGQGRLGTVTLLGRCQCPAPTND